MSAAPSWHLGHLVGLDTETTSPEPTEARIVTAAIVHVSPTARPRSMQWLIHPQTDIPDEAAEIHGWTLPRLEQRLQGHEALRIYQGQERFLTRDAALFEIAGQAASAMGRETPLIVHNAAFDLTLLEAELERNGIDTLASRPAGIRGVIDPMVLEQHFDRYRKLCYAAPGCDRENRHHECGGCQGSKKYSCGGCGATNRQLSSLCAHYGLVLAGAHDAEADTLGALRLAWKLGTLSPELARLRLQTLHKKQVEWRRDQQFRLKAFFEKVGKPTDDMCPEWPVHLECLRERQAVPA
ncbi:exonuclease domain-containing protein [Nocardioides sp. L-11A]|uniref:exonuclease domain-containing protein n=1 Tax=Nocardioides sp. L-11A TaxID=3043848 RepID=UPI00249BAC79|nr:exonuclease domain-containing protein [Nocardioides sp. L-11A]